MDVLEALTDKLPLGTILEMLERICHRKAEDLRHNCQDEMSAKRWDKAARQIEKINIDV